MLKVKRSDLLGVLGHLSGITADKDKSTVKFEAAPHGFGITADNGRQRMHESRMVTAGTDVESWACYIDARNLSRVVKAIDADVVSFQLNTRNGRLSVTGGNAEFTLNTQGEASTSFPPDMLQEAGTLSKVNALALHDALSAVLPSISEDDNKYGLNGVEIEWLPKRGGEGARMVSTDGSRLFYVPLKVESGELALNGKTLLPRETVLIILGITGGTDEVVEVGIGPNTATFYWPLSNIRLVSRLVDGMFPDYRQVIGTGKRTGELRIGAAVLADGLAKAGIMIDDRNKTIRMRIFPDMVHLSAVSSKSGDALVRVDASYSGQEGLTVGFNAKYLADTVKSCRAETVRLSLANPLDPVFVLPDDAVGIEGTLGVVMPVRLD